MKNQDEKVLAVVLYTPLVTPLWDFFIGGAVWNLTFNLFYNYLFVKK